MMIKRSYILIALSLISAINSFSQETHTPAQIIKENTPSKAVYFDWINRNWYGSNQEKIEANLRFFKWLHDEYGMQLDIYLMDAGDIDQGPKCAQTFGLPMYGSLESPHFKARFPNGFDPLVKLAASFNCRLGIWLGPDGYGDTPAQAKERKDMLVKFCRDYNFALFKFDACCSDLSAGNLQHFIETMQQCRTYVPDLIVLNHRITLNEEARRLTTTFLWEGRETCADVNIFNDTVAPHHRQGNLTRGLPPQLMRLTEDHGVCLSSVLENWDDDLILQAFNRNLILSPEIYGSPFLLSDDMYPRLARIYNLHRKYRDILVNARSLPENKYGKYAVSRGDSTTRLITLRNLSWQSMDVAVKLDSSTGIAKTAKVHVKQYHPYEKYIGEYNYGDEVHMNVMPFRAALIKISGSEESEPEIKGTDYHVVKSLPGGPFEVTLYGKPGSVANIELAGKHAHFAKMVTGNKEMPYQGQSIKVTFPGKNSTHEPLYKLGAMKKSDIPAQSAQITEHCNFALDNNALEVREVLKSGPTQFKAVEHCRNIFFNDTLFSKLGLWDKFAFDGDTSTFFNVRRYKYLDLKENTGSFRLDIGTTQALNTLEFRNVPVDYNPVFAELSENLEKWVSVPAANHAGTLTIKNTNNIHFRYLRLKQSPVQLSEIIGFLDGKTVGRQNWRASNLFSYPAGAVNAWTLDVKSAQIGSSGRIIVTVPAAVKENTLFAYITDGDTIIPATDRAPSFLYNNWEHYGISEKNFTYYIPVPASFKSEKLKVVLLSVDKTLEGIQPQAWFYNPSPLAKTDLKFK